MSDYTPEERQLMVSIIEALRELGVKPQFGVIDVLIYIRNGKYYRVEAMPNMVGKMVGAVKRIEDNVATK